MYKQEEKILTITGKISSYIVKDKGTKNTM